MGDPYAGSPSGVDVVSQEAGGQDGGPTNGHGGGRGDSFFRRPPGVVFHLALVLPAVAFLYSVSVPGFDFLIWIVAYCILGAAALIWFLRAGTYLWAVWHHRATGSARWWLVAPVAGALVLALIWTDAPLRVRWALSRGDFQDAVALAPPATDPEGWVTFEVPNRLGSYRIIDANRVGDGVIFYERTGAFSNDAGFAYLPSGPFEELETGWFESPQFRSLGDGWYAWTASW